MRIDHHVHILSPAAKSLLESKMGMQFLTPPSGDRSARGVIDAVGKAGFQRANVLSCAYLARKMRLNGERAREWIRHENRYVAEDVGRFPGILRGFAALDPLCDGCQEELSRAYEEDGMTGIKLHLQACGVDLKRQNHCGRVQDVFNACAAKQLDMVVHIGNPGVIWGREDARRFVRELLLPFPELRVQIAHLGGGGGYDLKTDEVFSVFLEEAFSQRRNLWLDLSGICLDPAKEREFAPAVCPEGPLKEELVRKIRDWGLDRILYGSDWPAFDTLKAQEVSLRTLDLEPVEWQHLFENRGLWTRETC